MLLCGEAVIATHANTVDAYFTDCETVPVHVVNCGEEMVMLCVLLAMLCTFQPAAPLAARYMFVNAFVCSGTHPYTAIALVLGETDLVQGNQHTR